jgi:Myb-like DNA-binding domain
MASRQSPMYDRSQQDTHLTVHSSSAGRVSSVHSRATPDGAAPTGPEQNHPPAPLPSPPFSPPSRKVDDFRRHSRHSSLPHDGTPTPMLQAATPENAKLDVARLLQAENTPPPSTSGAESSRAAHSRSNSVPSPNTHPTFAQSALHRSTVSASAAIPSAPYSNAPPPLTHQSPLSIYPTSAAPAQRPTLPPIQPPRSLPPAQSAVSSSSSYPHWSTSYPQHTPPVHVRPPSPHRVPSKRSAPSGPATSAPPAKRQSKWTPEEDALIIELRGGGMKWEEISKRLPGRSAISCRLHYQNYLERRSEWDEERKNRLARLYERYVNSRLSPRMFPNRLQIKARNVGPACSRARDSVAGRRSDALAVRRGGHGTPGGCGAVLTCRFLRRLWSSASASTHRSSLRPSKPGSIRRSTGACREPDPSPRGVCVPTSIRAYPERPATTAAATAFHWCHAPQPGRAGARPRGVRRARTSSGAPHAAVSLCWRSWV